MTLQAIIRPATPPDIGAVSEIFAHYVSHTVITFEEVPPGVAAWRHRLGELTGAGLPFLVAEVSGEVAGYAYAGPWRAKPAYRFTVEDTVYLAPGRTGQGLGGALLGGLVAGCAATGAHRMIAVIADTGDEASMALHRRHGFGLAGRLTGVGYKHGRWVDTVLMQRPVRPGDAGRATAPDAL